MSNSPTRFPTPPTSDDEAPSYHSSDYDTEPSDPPDDSPPPSDDEYALWGDGDDGKPDDNDDDDGKPARKRAKRCYQPRINK